MLIMRGKAVEYGDSSDVFERRYPYTKLTESRLRLAMIICARA